MTLGHARNTAIPVTSSRTGFRALSEPQENCQQQIDFAVKNLTAVKQVLESKDLSTDITLQEVLDRAHVTLDDYTKSLSISKCG